MPNRPVSAPVDLGGTSFGLESCLSCWRSLSVGQEDLYGKSILCQPPRALRRRGRAQGIHTVDWKNEMQYLITLSFTGMSVVFLLFTGSTKRQMARSKCVRELPKTYPAEGGHVLSLHGHKRSGPSGHPPGPLGVCNPNEKQKPPPVNICPSL